MNDWVLILILLVAIMVVIGIVLTVVAWKKRKERGYKEVDFRAFFIMGIAFLPVGVVFMIVFSQTDISFLPGLPMFLLGLIYLIIGLTNRDKRKKSVGGDK
jgi:Gpi18-like mannosyltransferase